MQLPLLVGTIPKANTCGPRVKLNGGMWSLVLEKSNSVLDLIYETPHSSSEGSGYLKHVISDVQNGHVLENTAFVQLQICSAGSERYINAHIKKVIPNEHSTSAVTN